jgi:HK97 family phage major capsid protein
MLAEEAAYAFAKAEDTNGFLGDGTTTYGNTVGIVSKINDGSHAGSIYTAASTHTGFETITLADCHGLVAKCPTYARAGAKFYISPTGFDSCLSRLMYASGGVTVEQVAGGVQYRFLGYPVELSEVLNSTAGADTSAIKFLFGNLGQASTMGDRMGISIATDSSRYFEADQVAFKATQRVDIVNHDCGDASVAGPVIAMKTPGS